MTPALVDLSAVSSTDAGGLAAGEAGADKAGGVEALAGGVTAGGMVIAVMMVRGLDWDVDNEDDELRKRR